ncbi:inactive N-acetylated-alpha-linked acidic dipeptidase-like protein 2 [Astyanax mexicanus]|uniref:Inactive N-acetylated-alpha-linked acidic dipeptidase-like protein 2 n=1 Tax=Astyanax mexicanus TaxID=7994 RepID=A0A8T2LAX7_ASTMX|nr:inactive N-acetylated-alpha-linked acidic dipeptidase-like protein 2 [Astyanax mexicanus]
MAYRKVCASRGSAAISQDLESEGLQMASLDMEWEMEKELEEPGGLDHFQLEHRPMETSSSGAMDPDLEPIQPSASPHGRFQRLQEDPNYTSHFSRTMPKSQRRSGACIAKYLLAGAGVFFLGLLIGLYTHRAEKQPEISNQSTDLLERVVQSITAEKIQALQREFQATTSEEDRVKGLAQKWEELGLKNVQLSSYNVLLSHPGPRPNTIVDMTTKHCYLPSGHSCDTWGNPSYSTEQLFAMATYSAVGTLEAEVVDVQYGSSEDLRRIRAEMNVTNKIAVLKLGQAPLLYTLSRLAEMGFGGSLLYVEPCDVITEQEIWWKAFGVTLNPGGDPSTPDYPSTDRSYRADRRNLTSLLVQPISTSLAKVLLYAPAMGIGRPCVPLAMTPPSERKIVNLTIGSRTSYGKVHNVVGYLRGKINPDRYVLVGGRHSSWYEGTTADWSGSAAAVTQIIESITAQARAGWQPDRTIVFCSWGGSALGNIGSFEWGEENRLVLESRAVAYVSLHSPVRPRGPQSTASPSLLQLASDIGKKQVKSCTEAKGCPDLNVSSLQSPVALDFFSSHLAVPALEFAFSANPTERAHFLSEAFFPSESLLAETLDPAFRLHEAVAKMTAEAILRLSTDPVLPFYPLDIALDIQNKLKDDPLSRPDLLAAAASLRDNSSFFQSEIMRPANDPKERDPSHVRMLNDVLRDLEKSFLVSSPPPGFSRNILYGLNTQTPGFAILKAAQEEPDRSSVDQSLSQVSNSISSAEKLVYSGLELFENDPEDSSY